MVDKVFDLNSIHRPTFVFTFGDEARTQLHVKTPNLNLAKEMQDIAAGTGAALVNDSDDFTDVLYQFLSKVLSNNREHITIAAEDLEKKYHMDLESALLTFAAYMDFVTNIATEKN